MKRKVIRKLFWAWEFDKEEKWLNAMAQDGWALEKVGYCKYVFAQCEKGEYIFRLEMLENAPDSEEAQDYISFVEDTGAEYIGNVMKWVYFRKKASEGEFEMFSDTASKVNHVDRIVRLAQLMGILGLINLSIGLINLRLSGLGWINIACAALTGLGCWKIYQLREDIQNRETQDKNAE